MPSQNRHRTLRIDEDTAIALQRLANSQSRSQNAQMIFLIREAAVSAGLWTPRRQAPELVSVSPRHRSDTT